MEDTRTPNRVIMGTIDDKKLKGRPRKRRDLAIAGNARKIVGSAVSYTHLDVYKRQVLEYPKRKTRLVGLQHNE